MTGFDLIVWPEIDRGNQIAQAIMELQNVFRPASVTRARTLSTNILAHA